MNQSSLTIFKIWELNAKNNIKTPLGLLSLMINLNHNHDYVPEITNQTTTKELEMEF